MVNGMANRGTSELGGESVAVCPKGLISWVFTPVFGECGIMVKVGCRFSLETPIFVGRWWDAMVMVMGVGESCHVSHYISFSKALISYISFEQQYYGCLVICHDYCNSLWVGGPYATIDFAPKFDVTGPVRVSQITLCPNGCWSAHIFSAMDGLTQLYIYKQKLQNCEPIDLP